MADKFTARHKELLDEYGPGCPPQPNTLHFYDYDPFERLPDDPNDQIDLETARLLYWALKGGQVEPVTSPAPLPTPIPDSKERKLLSRASTQTLPRRPRGPNPAKRNAAEMKLKQMLRKGELTVSQLIDPVEKGGSKRADIGDRIGIGRTTVPQVISSVLNDPEFADR